MRWRSSTVIEDGRTKSEEIGDRRCNEGAWRRDCRCLGFMRANRENREIDGWIVKIFWVKKSGCRVDRV